MKFLDLTKYEGHTQGPWTDHGYNTGDIFGVTGSYPAIIECDSGYYGPHGADRALIIDAPLLLEELKKAYAEIAELEDEIKKTDEWISWKL